MHNLENFGDNYTIQFKISANSWMQSYNDLYIVW